MGQANAGTLAEGRWATNLASFFKNEIQIHSLVYALIFLLLAETVIVSWFMNDPLWPFVLTYAQRAMKAAQLLLLGGFVLVAAGAMLQRKEPSPFRYLGGIAVHLWKGNIAPRYAYACTVMTVFFAAFLYNKMLIPKLNAFHWDATFAEWDRLLFGGWHPWQLLHPFLSTPSATIFLDVMYALWIPLVFIGWCLSFASPNVPAAVRHRYWLATVASWIVIGLVLATAFSSAGPCYFENLITDQPSPYAGLNAYLSSVHAAYPLGSTLTKEYLWDIYQGGYDIPGGISAMPSMHNAQAALFAAAGYCVSRRLGHVMLAYAVIIFVGSIHLGWHYAIDGIVGALLALVIWWIAGMVVKRGDAASVGLS